MQVDELKTEALRLSARDRAKLAQELLLSLDEEVDPDAEQMWLDEAERRYAAYKRGEMTARPVDQAIRDIRAKLK